MSETVRDIPGKGFKYEQRSKTTVLTEALTGLIGAYVGGANWGPMGKPTFVVKDFEKYFGIPLTKLDMKDSSGISAQDFLNYSSRLWFTRVSDGTAQKSFKALTKDAQKGSIVGTSVLTGRTFVIASGDNTLSVNDDGTPKAITLDPTPAAAPIDSLDLSGMKTDGSTVATENYVPGAYIEFKIDGVVYQHFVNGTTSDGDVPYFTELADEADTQTWAAEFGASTWAQRLAEAVKAYILIPAGMTEVQADAAITVASGKLRISSGTVGDASSVAVVSFPKAYAPGVVSTQGVNTGVAAIAAKIASALTNVDAYVNAEGRFELRTKTAGASHSVGVTAISAGVSAILGFSAGATASGKDPQIGGGILQAKYSGADGNTIKLVKNAIDGGYVLVVYFREKAIATFVNYSYDTTKANFIGALLANDANCSEVVEYIAPTLPDGVTSVEPFPYGEIALAGGSSGVAGLNDSHYVSALEEYKNLDLYEIDVLCVSGNVAEVIADKLQEVCEYRQDCYSIVDSPEDVSGVPAGNAAVYSAINWHNGATGRSKKLASRFVATYFPWLRLDKATLYNQANSKQWYAPSVRVMGAIANSYKNAKCAAPAGHIRGKINDVLDLAVYLREDDKAKLYGDEYGNAINPIVYNHTMGFYIDGQKNTDREFGALSRINVLATALGLKRDIANIAPNYFWRELTTTTLNDFYADLEAIAKSYVKINAMKANYVITVDTELNSLEVQASRGLIGSIEWEGVESIEKIKVISTVRDYKVSTKYA